MAFPRFRRPPPHPTGATHGQQRSSSNTTKKGGRKYVSLVAQRRNQVERSLHFFLRFTSLHCFVLLLSQLISLPGLETSSMRVCFSTPTQLLFGIKISHFGSTSPLFTLFLFYSFFCLFVCLLLLFYFLLLNVRFFHFRSALRMYTIRFSVWGEEGVCLGGLINLLITVLMHISM